MKKIVLSTDWKYGNGIVGVLYTEYPLPPGQYVAWADLFFIEPERAVRVEDGDWARAERALGIHDYPWMPIVRFEVVEE